MKNGPYELIVAPEDYPGKKYRGRYCYEHVFKWWKKHGVLPPKGYEIHHRDHNHRNNKDNNLELISAKDHRKLHAQISSMKAKIEVICGFCKKKFIRRGNDYRSKRKNNKTGLQFCTRVCQHESMKKVIDL